MPSSTSTSRCVIRRGRRELGRRSIRAITCIPTIAATKRWPRRSTSRCSPADRVRSDDVDDVGRCVLAGAVIWRHDRRAVLRRCASPVVPALRRRLSPPRPRRLRLRRLPAPGDASARIGVAGSPSRRSRDAAVSRSRSHQRAVGRRDHAGPRSAADDEGRRGACGRSPSARCRRRSGATTSASTAST